MHTITGTATDSYGHVSSSQTTITVSASGATTTTTASSGSSLSALETQLDQLESQIAAQSGGASSSALPSFTFENELVLGQTSSDVTQLQTVLKQQGYFSGSATGYFGAQTQAAVEAFQSAHGIAAVGYVGPSTRAALNAVLSGGSTSASASTSAGDGYVFNNFIGSGQTSNDVTELQKKLTALGFYSGPTTGYFGSLTQAAVEAFQSAHSISAVGYVGPGTRAALNE